MNSQVVIDKLIEQLESFGLEYREWIGFAHYLDVLGGKKSRFGVMFDTITYGWEDADGSYQSELFFIKNNKVDEAVQEAVMFAVGR